MNELSSEYLKSILEYNPETGLWVYIKRVANCIHIGDIAGYNRYYKKRNGYYHIILIKNKPFLSHRLSFLYMNGTMPREYVDHINGNTIDNRWCNLRECSKYENAHNHKPFSKESKLPQGVFFNCKKYGSLITFMGNKIFLGNYSTIKEAEEAYVNKRNELYKEFSRA